jgi:Na+/melibiose symporter-like transporter
VSTSYEGTSPPAAERPSIGELLSDISTDLSTLMRQEVALAKAELTQSAKQAGKGAGMLAGAGVAGHFVLLFISIWLWWSIGDKTGHGWSALIVAALWAIIAAVLAARGRKEMKNVNGVPRTADTVKKIPSAVAGNEETR